MKKPNFKISGYSPFKAVPLHRVEGSSVQEVLKQLDLVQYYPLLVQHEIDMAALRHHQRLFKGIVSREYRTYKISYRIWGVCRWNYLYLCIFLYR